MVSCSQISKLCIIYFSLSILFSSDLEVQSISRQIFKTNFHLQRVCVYVNIYIYICIHMCVCVCMYIYIHTHTCKHIHSHCFVSPSISFLLVKNLAPTNVKFWCFNTSELLRGSCSILINLCSHHSFYLIATVIQSQFFFVFVCFVLFLSTLDKKKYTLVFISLLCTM